MPQPQIIGFGAQKAGTTWLFDNLATNPGVWRPVLKEMHFFNHVQSGSRWMFKKHRARLLAQKEQALVKGLKRRMAYLDRLLSIPMLSEEWYREAYRPCPSNKQSMDITPAYALLDENTIRHMDVFLGNDYKAIYLIRDPADRAISSIKREAAGSVAEGIDYWIEKICAHSVRARSDYRSTISRLDNILGDRVLYLPFSMVKQNPKALLRYVEKHCGLPEGEYAHAEKPKHVSPLITLPPEINEVVKTLLADQYDWLKARFGKELLGYPII